MKITFFLIIILTLSFSALAQDTKEEMEKQFRKEIKLGVTGKLLELEPTGALVYDHTCLNCWSVEYQKAHPDAYKWANEIGQKLMAEQQEIIDANKKTPQNSRNSRRQKRARDRMDKERNESKMTTIHN